MTNVSNDRFVLHLLHVLEPDNVVVSGRCDEDICEIKRLFQRLDFQASHRSLQSTDRVDLSHDNASTLADERLHATLAHIAVATNHSDFARHHHVGRTVQSVDQRVTATVNVVKLALGARVVNIDRGEQQSAVFFSCDQIFDTRCCFF